MSSHPVPLLLKPLKLSLGLLFQVSQAQGAARVPVASFHTKPAKLFRGMSDVSSWPVSTPQGAYRLLMKSSCHHMSACLCLHLTYEAHCSYACDCLRLRLTAGAAAVLYYEEDQSLSNQEGGRCDTDKTLRKWHGEVREDRQ